MAVDEPSYGRQHILASESAQPPLASAPARNMNVWEKILRFLTYGANSDSARPRTLFYRHKLVVRIAHWVNAVVITFMFMSGLQIFNAHPALYFGNQSTFDHPVLSLTAVPAADGSLHGITQIGSWHFDTTGLLGASRVDGTLAARGFPSWATIPGLQWLSMARLYHFFFAWFFVINGTLFAIWALQSGHLRRDLLPTGQDIKHLPHEIVAHAQLKFPHGEAAKRYNALQKLTYFLVIFGLGPLVVLTGLTMSPTMDAAFPFLPWIFAGRQTARMIHFICAFSFLGFFIIHMIMVFLSGTYNNICSMVTGRYAIEGERRG